MLAFRQARLGAGRSLCCVNDFGVPLGGNLCLCNDDLIADGAVLALSLARFGASRLNCRINDLGMSLGGDFFLGNEYSIADGAVLAFGQTSLSAGWSLCCIDYFCLIGFAGVVLINLNGVDFHMQANGEGFILLSTIVYAFSSVFLKRYSAKHNPVMLSGYQFIVGGVILILCGLLLGGQMGAVSASVIGILVYLAFVSAVAYSLWGLLLKYNPVSKVAVFGFMNPVFGVILSAWLLDEREQAFGALSIISLVLVCVGIYIVNKKNENC